MRTYVLLFLIMHTTLATIDLQKLKVLKETASTKLQTLHDSAAMQIQTLKETATSQFDAFREKATSAVDQLTDKIDLKKIQQYDVLELLPKIEFTGKFVEQKIQGIPEQTKKVKLYLQSLKGLTGKDFVLAFDADIPWAVKRRMDFEDDGFEGENKY